jgi:histidine triad (HIT) family protein
MIIIFLQKFYVEKFLAIKFTRMILFYHFMILILKRKIHALVIPKGKYVDLDDFSLKASSEEMVGLIRGINIVAKKLGISTEVGKGYRALANISDHGGQEVPHLHFHLFGGEKVGKMVE